MDISERIAKQIGFLTIQNAEKDAMIEQLQAEKQELQAKVEAKPPKQPKNA